MSPAATMSPDAAQRSVLRAADELFYAHGISGVVMSDIRDASGVSMRRLYVMYPSKSELVAAWLTDRHDTWMAWFASGVERHVAGGGDPVLATFDAIAEWVTTPGYRGCAFINSLAETSEIQANFLLVQSDETAKPLLPLPHQVGAVNNHQGTDLSLGDNSRCGDRLSKCGGCDQHAEIMFCDSVERFLLIRAQHTVERRVHALPHRTCVVQTERNFICGKQCLDIAQATSRQRQKFFVVFCAADDPGGIPCGPERGLKFVEVRILERRNPD